MRTDFFYARPSNSHCPRSTLVDHSRTYPSGGRRLGAFSRRHSRRSRAYPCRFWVPLSPRFSAGPRCHIRFSNLCGTRQSVTRENHCPADRIPGNPAADSARSSFDLTVITLRGPRGPRNLRMCDPNHTSHVGIGDFDICIYAYVFMYRWGLLCMCGVHVRE